MRYSCKRCLHNAVQLIELNIETHKRIAGSLHDVAIDCVHICIGRARNEQNVSVCWMDRIMIGHHGIIDYIYLYILRRTSALANPFCYKTHRRLNDSDSHLSVFPLWSCLIVFFSWSSYIKLKSHIIWFCFQCNFARIRFAINSSMRHRGRHHPSQRRQVSCRISASFLHFSANSGCNKSLLAVCQLYSTSRTLRT